MQRHRPSPENPLTTGQEVEIFYRDRWTPARVVEIHGDIIDAVLTEDLTASGQTIAPEGTPCTRTRREVRARQPKPNPPNRRLANPEPRARAILYMDTEDGVVHAECTLIAPNTNLPGMDAWVVHVGTLLPLHNHLLRGETANVMAPTDSLYEPVPHSLWWGPLPPNLRGALERVATNERRRRQQTAILYRRVMAGTIHAECRVVREVDFRVCEIDITRLLPGHTLNETCYPFFGVRYTDLYCRDFLFEPTASAS